MLQAEADTEALENPQPKSEKKASKDKKRSKSIEPAAPPSKHDADIAELLAEAEDPPTKKQRKKERWTDEQKEAARVAKGLDPVKVRGATKEEGAEGEANGAGDADKAKKKREKEDKKKKKKDELNLRPLKPEERISGPSNADEAVQMRGVLGFTKPDAPTRATFGFGFVPGATEPQSTPPVAASNGAKQDTSSSDDDDTSSGDSDKGAVAAQPISSSDEESDDTTSSDISSGSSSSDDDDSSSDEEDVPEVLKKNMKQASSSSDSDSSSSDDEEEARPALAAAPVAAVAPTSYPQQQSAPASAPGGGVAYEGMDSEFVPRRVYCGGMPYSYTEGQVHEYWSYCGDIESLDLLTFPDTGRFRGIAFITFTTVRTYCCYDSQMNCPVSHSNP